MPEPNRLVASSRSMLFLISPVSLDSLPLGFVENFSANKQIMSENALAVGAYIPPDNVVNAEQGRVQWGRFYTRDPALTAIVTPRIASFMEFEAYRLLAMDPKDGKAIALAIDVLPEAFDLQLRGGAAARNNYTGLCRAILLDDEISRALGG